MLLMLRGLVRTVLRGLRGSAHAPGCVRLVQEPPEHQLRLRHDGVGVWRPHLEYRERNSATARVLFDQPQRFEELREVSSAEEFFLSGAWGRHSNQHGNANRIDGLRAWLRDVVYICTHARSRAFHGSRTVFV